MGEVVYLDEERAKRSRPVKTISAAASRDRGKLIADAFRKQEDRLAQPKVYPVLDREWDEEAMRDVVTYHLNSDPGDER